MVFEGIMIEVMSDSFDLIHIFDCGQCFRWEAVGNHDYIGISEGRVLRVTQKGTRLAFFCEQNEADGYWRDYFDLNTDYEGIKSTLLAADPTLTDAIEFGAGIRLLNQNRFEMLMTFILSANNHIPRIRSLVKRLSETYGVRVEHPWEAEVGPLYAFPTPEALAKASIADLRKLGLGYRDRYVYESAKKVADDPVCLSDIQNMPYREAKQRLLSFSGVGPKVADCILLFSAGRHEAFPIDTWIKKTLARRYNLADLTPKELERWIDQTFGSLKGYAQQYLFYYEREHGKEKGI